LQGFLKIDLLRNKIEVMFGLIDAFFFGVPNSGKQPLEAFGKLE